jgi:hypothetical protein
MGQGERVSGKVAPRAPPALSYLVKGRQPCSARTLLARIDSYNLEPGVQTTVCHISSTICFEVECWTEGKF